MNNFLFIVNAFPPINNQNSLRALELSKRLVKQGIFPIILTRRIEKREPKDYSLVREIPKILKVYRSSIIELKRKYSLKTLFFKLTQKIFYLYTYIHWVPFGYLAGKYLLENNKDIKFIYATGPPYYSHMIAYKLKKKFNLPLIIEYRDPWNFHPYGTKSKIDFNELISLRVEKRILKSVNMIITISEALKEFLLNNFSEIKKIPIYSVSNGLNIQEDLLYEKKK